MSVRRAFALVPALLLASLCVAVALLCHSAGTLAGASARSSSVRGRCKLAALAAARLGCGVLAQSLGPDVRWSGTDAAGVAWVAWRRRSEGGEDEVWERRALAGRQADGRGAVLEWRAADLACRSDIAAPWLARERGGALARRPRMRQRLASGATLPEPSPALLASARVGDAAVLRAYQGVSAAGSTTAGTRSLLIDPATGAWRENLSCVDVLAGRLGQPLAEALLSPSAAVREQPARGMEPVDVGTGAARLRHVPVLTDLALSIGVFNARSDGRHRVRMHAQMTLWNPSALPLLTPSDKRLFLAEIEGAPEITVTNLDSGASFSTWLDRCPPGVFWSYTQGPRERGIWWWVEVLDSARHGMLRSGILPGEVYSLLMPDPAAQPYGLSRVIGADTWRYDPAEHAPGWTRPAPEVFLPDDRIVVALRFVTPGTTLRLHPYVGPLPAGMEAADYGSPAVLTLAHVPWSDGRLELTGAEYSRIDSNGYVIGERRFCWRARLVAQSDAALFALAQEKSLMGSDVDLADPVQRGRWALSADPVVEAREAVDAFAGAAGGVLRDGFVNRHEAAVDGAFADWRLRDVPVDPPLDVGSLRLLHGVPLAMWMGELDRAFFACPDMSDEQSLSENPRLTPWSVPRSAEEQAALRLALLGPDAARWLALEGAFNVNSQDATAWESFLCSVPLSWEADSGGLAPPGHIESRAGFFSQPTGAMLAKFASDQPCDESDERREQRGEDAGRLSMRRQSVRAPSADAIRRFSEHLVAEIGRESQPFAGVGSFLASGVVERALASSLLNDGIDAGSPLALDGPTVLGAHLALLVARGDTFSVVGEARVDGARMALELTVQRVPESAAKPHLGRRFVVTKARWLDSAAR